MCSLCFPSAAVYLCYPGSKFLGSKDHAALCAFTGKTGWDTAIDDLSRWSYISHDKNRVVQIDFGGSGEGSVLGKALECTQRGVM